MAHSRAVDAQVKRLECAHGKTAAILPGERSCAAGMMQSNRLVQGASSARAAVQLTHRKWLARIRRAAISIPYGCAPK
ncbi:hypothetical protein BCAR13_1060136 [Paraburkholderia caribensis]|nr:hypothetical protein BCAR13_1060136 [Paraburkholderia caribensis]